MGNIYEIQKKLNKTQSKSYENELNMELNEKDFYLKDSDFYPPVDTRTLHSLIEDIGEGDNYLEYAEYIYNLYEEEGYYEN